MFMGEYNHTIDAKGRLIVPSKFREQLGDEFVVTKGLDGCLFVYDNSEWKNFEEKLQSLPLTNTNARKFSRFFWPELLPVRWTSREGYSFRPYSGSLRAWRRKWFWLVWEAGSRFGIKQPGPRRMSMTTWTK